MDNRCQNNFHVQRIRYPRQLLMLFSARRSKSLWLLFLLLGETGTRLQVRATQRKQSGKWLLWNIQIFSLFFAAFNQHLNKGPRYWPCCNSASIIREPFSCGTMRQTRHATFSKYTIKNSQVQKDSLLMTTSASMLQGIFTF